MVNQRELKRTKKELLMEGTRYPRPQGLTLALIQISQSPNKTQQNKELQIIKDNLIQSWILNGLRINGQILNGEQLANYLQLPLSYILRKTGVAMNKMGKWIGNEDFQDLSRALFSQAFFGILESRSRVQNQVQILATQQGEEYVPFLTSELNKILATEVASTKPFIDLLNLLKPAQTIVPIAHDNPANQHTVTPDEAINLIRDSSQSLIQNPDLLEAKWAQLNASEGIPDVNARHQDLTSIGIRHTPKKALPAPSSSTQSMPNPTAQSSNSSSPKKASKKDKGDDVPIPSQHRKRANYTNIITSADGIEADDFRL